MMRLSFFGACREVGRSAVLLDAGKRILFDFGVKLGPQKNEYPLAPKPAPDAFVLSHAHLDHSGFAPSLYARANIPCFTTPPTAELCGLLLRDSLKVSRLKNEPEPYSLFQLKKLEQAFVPLAYGRQFPLSRDTSITMYDAGHVPGAAITSIYSQGKKVVYSGDFKMASTLLHAGAKPVAKADALVIESTYSGREHPDRAKLDRTIIAEVRKTLDVGGSVLFPAFALGRSQELLMLISQGVPGAHIFLDGMSRTATEIISRYPQFIRDAKALKKAMQRCTWVESESQRRKAVAEPSVIISSAGMLEGGPSLSYLIRLNAKSKIILTGYQVEGTNARTLLEKRYVEYEGTRYDVKIPVEFLDMSAHAGRTDLLEFVSRASPEKIFCIHGDSCEEFAEELNGMGFSAYAPRPGNSFDI